MDDTILVTGGTGTLGREVVARLRAAGHGPRVLSRRPGHGRVVGDLDTGTGLDAAARGAAVVVHAATRPGHDVAGTRRLVEALHRTGTRPHLLYVSIVGVDRVPLGYRDKATVEDLIRAPGLPWTILRATQFHDLLDMIFTRLSAPGPAGAGRGERPAGGRPRRRRPARRAGHGRAGRRVPDLGGPQVWPMAELARAWLAARGRRRPVLPVRLPGAVVRGYRAGGHLTPEHADGRHAFAEFLTPPRAGHG